MSTKLIYPVLTGFQTNRRSFLKGTLAASVSMSFAGRTFAQTSPAKGGKFTIGLSKGSTTDSLDPATYLDYYMATVGWGCLGNGLTQVDAKGAIQPDLAESFAAKDGGSTWVIKLRQGLTFHNGKPVTPADVIASIKHHQGADSKSAMKDILSDVKDIKADGDDVVFTLGGPNADFPYVLSDYHLPIMPAKEDGTADWASGIRTGPYKLDSFEPGVTTKMSRNPNYHRETWFDSIEVIAIIDPAARTNALLNGDIDYMDSCDPKALALLQASPDVNVVNVAGQSHNTFSMDVTNDKFKDPNVRNALKYAVDRDAILQKVFNGLGTVADDNPVAPAMKYFKALEPKHSYDPEMAKSLLKKAGMSTLDVDLSTSDAAYNGAVDAAVLFQDSAKAAGININVVREPNDGYWDNVWMKKPFVASNWYGRPTAGWLLELAYVSPSTWNECRWKNPHFDELIKSAKGELDDTKRAEMYAECQQLIQTDGGLINLMFNNFVSAHRKNVAHGDVLTNWDIDGLRIAERWWKAS